MKLSIELLVATLGLSQFNGVVGDAKKDREQLRRNLRRGTRKTQTVPGVIFTDDAIKMDDFFHVSEGVADVGISQVDDFFSQYDDDFFGDDVVVHDHVHEHEMGEEDDHDHDPEPVFGGKATKVGKALWDETPIMTKGLKSGKGLKSLKAAKSGLLKDSKSGKDTKSYKSMPSPYYDSVGRTEEHSSDEDDHDHDHVDEDGVMTTGGGWMDAFNTQDALSYGDIFETGDAEVAERSDYDFSATTADEFQDGGGSTLMTSRMEGAPSAPAARSGITFDDDYFNEDERLVFLPRPVVTLAGSLFSVNPQTVIQPVVPDASGNTLTLGTEYLFNEVMTDAQNINSQIVPIQVDSEMVLFVVALDGYCDRIGPADQNSVQGYCFFTYTLIDPATQLTGGSFTAQGIIVNSDVPGQLTVTGGTGILTGAAGLVEILPASVDSQINPPELIQPPSGSDPFNGIAGWAHFVQFDVDVLFFLPELYAR